MEAASDLVVSDQHAFVSKAVIGARRVLEVGAGPGQLARRLQADGLGVTALDLSLPTKDKSSGVRWVEGDFLNFEAEPFDAVVFTASLHHISPLEEALARCVQLVRRGGALVVDDFDLESADEATARWYYELQDLLVVAGVYHPARMHESRARPPLERWHAEHEHHDAPLHGGQAMLSEIEKRFGSIHVARGSYLYRYLCDGLTSVNVARHIMSVEERRIADASLRAVGLRVVARRQ